MKKIITKTMQIDNREFQKCKSGQEFKAKFISQSGPRPPVGMPKWFKVWSEEVYEKNQHRLKTDIAGVKSTLDDYGKRITRLEQH